MALRRSAATFLLLALVAALGGCGSSTRPNSPRAAGTAPLPAATPAELSDSLLAHVNGRSVGVYRSVAARRPTRFLANPTQYGFPLVLLVKRSLPGWLDVYLPSRPNGSTGWIRQADARLTQDPFRVTVNLRRHRLTVSRGPRIIDRAPVGVGHAVTPTPSGVYFITELFRLTSPDGPYGPYGFGLSAYSNVLHEFAGGNGQIGIHGTNDPAGIGSDVSHGCIRLANPQITKLARLLPLGTPVRIER